MTKVPIVVDPVLVQAWRCRRAADAIERKGYPYQVHVSAEADRAFDEREELVLRMIETPASSLRGVIAKLQEIFALGQERPDLETWTVQHVVDDLKRLAGIV